MPKKKEENNIEMEEKNDAKKSPYIYTVGRRKRSIATVRLYTKGKGEIKINDKEITQYFKTKALQQIVYIPLKTVGEKDIHDITIHVKGGGIHSQAESIRHGIAQALVKFNPDFRKNLKTRGFLTRDAREKERKKPGLKRARRAPQWSKR